MKNIRIFLSENFPFMVVKFSIYLNRRVFVMRLMKIQPFSLLLMKINVTYLFMIQET